MRISSLLSAFLLLCPFVVFGQMMTLDEVTDQVLNNNFLLKVEQNTNSIAKLNTSVYSKSILPTFGIQGSTNYSLGNSLNRYSAIPEIQINNAGSVSGNIGIIGSYPVLTGGVRKYTNEKNQASLALSELRLEQTKEDLLLNAYSLFYQIAKSQQGIEALEESLTISKKRLEKAKYNFEFGKNSSIDTLNARVDINRDSTNILILNQQINRLMQELNLILCRDPSTNFSVDTNIVLEFYSDKAGWMDQSFNMNTTLTVFEQNIEIAVIDESLAVANQRPFLQFDAGYNLSFVDNNENSFVTFQRSNGFQVGLSLNWNLFDGGQTYIRRQTSKILTENQYLQKQNYETQLKKEIETQWIMYQTNLSIVRLEQLNIETARQNFIRSEALYKQAQMGTVEFRQAQLNLLHAKLSYYNALYDAKINEVNLKYLSGSLY